MPTLNAFIPGPPDAKLKLQDAVTRTADFAGPWLDLGRGFKPGGLGMPVAGVITVTAIDEVTGDETYDFTLEEADANEAGAVDVATVRDVGASVAATATGIVIAKGFVTSRFVRLSLDVAGTTPSVSYQANLNP